MTFLVIDGDSDGSRGQAAVIGRCEAPPYEPERGSGPDRMYVLLLALARHFMRIKLTSRPTIDVLSAVKASLRAGVTALSEDNWMFEPEPQARH